MFIPKDIFLWQNLQLFGIGAINQRFPGSFVRKIDKVLKNLYICLQVYYKEQ